MEGFKLNLHYSDGEVKEYFVKIPRIEKEYYYLLKIEIDTSVFDYIEFNMIRYFRSSAETIGFDARVPRNIEKMNTFIDYISYLMISAAQINFIRDREEEFKEYMNRINISQDILSIDEINNRLRDGTLEESDLMKFYAFAIKEPNNFDTFLDNIEKELESKMKRFNTTFGNFYKKNNR